MAKGRPLAKRRLGCPCNCHDPEMREVLPAMPRHDDCTDCIRDCRLERRLLRATERAILREMREERRVFANAVRPAARA